MHAFYFDAFIDAIIASEPVICEPISILQRIDFQNGCGEHSLLTHLRILMKTLSDYTGKMNINMSSLVEISKSYKNVRRNDIELAYRIISPDLKPLTFRIMKKFFIFLSRDSMEKIMKCIQKQHKYDVVNELKQYDSIPSASLTSNPMKYAVDDLFPQLVMEIPENKRKYINTPVPSPINDSLPVEVISKPENKDTSITSWICWIFGCHKSE
jgi:hypothetical protein